MSARVIDLWTPIGKGQRGLSVSPLLFFFQAEDGIRDKLVTGVQTCALPIYEALLSIVPRDRRKIYAMRKIIESAFDAGSFFEIVRGFGKSAITGFARLDGWPVAVDRKSVVEGKSVDVGGPRSMKQKKKSEQS